MNPFSFIPGFGAVITGGQTAYNLANAALDPNRDLLPGVTVNNRAGQTDVNPFNNNTNKAPTAGGNTGNKPGSSNTQWNEQVLGNGVVGGGGNAASGPRYDPNELAGYDQAIGQINSSIGRLDPQLNVAYGNIGTQFNQGLNELNSSRDKAQSQYNTQTTTNQQNYRTDKNTIADGASQNLRALQRQLGAMGAGGGSDALYVAPKMVTDQASQQRAGAGQAFSQNQQGLDTNWGQFQIDFGNERKKLDDWQSQQRNSALQQSQSTRQSLLAKLAELNQQRASLTGGNSAAAAQGYINEANSLSSQIDALGRINPTYTGKSIAYQAPTLSSYQVDNGGVSTQVQGQPGGQVDPNIALLLGGKKDEQLINPYGFDDLNRNPYGI